MTTNNTTTMGAFSVSLSVKDLQASKRFYASMGFEPFAGEEDQGWLILQNGIATIGLFQGMFEGNIMTFNPGWDANASQLASFTDVRELQRRLKAQGLDLLSEVDGDSGPGSFMLADPDGNVILVAQHVAS